MAGERDWVEELKTRLAAILHDDYGIESQKRLPYFLQAASYSIEKNTPTTEDYKYQIDLLISETLDRSWIPRVAIECKLGRVTTHDALTYSAKAATHKHVHPYLRYGILIGDLGEPLPARLLRHGQNFDFMVAFDSATPNSHEWANFVTLIQEEINASVCLTNLAKGRKKDFSFLHRPLVLK